MVFSLVFPFSLLSPPAGQILVLLEGREKERAGGSEKQTKPYLGKTERKMRRKEEEKTCTLLPTKKITITGGNLERGETLPEAQ